MLTKAQYNQERQIESKARCFAQQVFRNAKKAFNSPMRIDSLICAGYATQRKEGIDLVGYKDLSGFIHSLNSRELRKFIFIFINQVHQGAYHICNRDLRDFEKFSNMNHIVEVRKIEKGQKNGKNEEKEEKGKIS